MHVAYYCGQAARFGAVPLAAGTPANVLPCSPRIMMHQPQAAHRHGLRHQHTSPGNSAPAGIIRNSTKHNGKSAETVARDTDRDYFMSAEEAKKYGLVDSHKPPHQKLRLPKKLTLPQPDNLQEALHLTRKKYLFADFAVGRGCKSALVIDRTSTSDDCIKLCDSIRIRPRKR